MYPPHQLVTEFVDVSLDPSVVAGNEVLIAEVEASREVNSPRLVLVVKVGDGGGLGGVTRRSEFGC